MDPSHDAAVDAPRRQAGPHPQHLLATLLGEYLDSAEPRVPAAAVVAALAEFGITRASARAALGRLVRRGLVTAHEPAGAARAPGYHLAARAVAQHRAAMHAFLAFGATPRPPVDRWSVVAYSLPQAHHAERHAVRRALAGLGCARLYDSVWIRPATDAAPVRAALAALLDDLPGARWSVMTAAFDDLPAAEDGGGGPGPAGPAAAYDVDGVADGYHRFVATYGPLRAAVRAGRVGPREALVARTTMTDAWRVLVDLDPDLPDDLLPRDWPRPAARALLLEVHEALGEPAATRLVDVMAPAWPDARRWITWFVAAADPTVPPRPGRP